MKAYKGCVNRECKSYKTRTHYKDDFEYCPICGEKLEYVCENCWKVLDSNTDKYCERCKMEREQKRELRKQNAKKCGSVIIGTAVAFSSAAIKHKDKITKVAMKIVKK